MVDHVCLVRCPCGTERVDSRKQIISFKSIIFKTARKFESHRLRSPEHTRLVLFPLIDYTEVIGMYNEKLKSKAEKHESHP